MDKRLVSVMTSILNVTNGEVVDSLTMDDLDAWDSLKHMALISGIEEAFSLQLSFDEIVNMRSVRDINNVLRGRGVIG